MNSAADRWRLITGADKTIPGHRSATAYQLIGETPRPSPSLFTRPSSHGNDVVKHKLGDSRTYDDNTDLKGRRPRPHSVLMFP